MTQKSYEVLCKPILENLRQIEAIVSAEENHSIFDVNTNAKTKDAHSELVRLRASLEQYMGRKGALSYVGFLGHFSAGKSRTINSLLDENRPHGQNPTDTAITLITHESNSTKLIATHTQGALAIGRALYDHAILKNTVIVDTPGSGDPSIVEELVRDFLPICDRLIYTFSAASPLDRSDLPVLLKARSELPFIPINIVITRADEFRIDPLKPLANENFDQEAAANFKTTFCMRLLKDVYELAVSPDDILLIDNITSFNINALKAMVIPEEEIGPQAAVELHSHKIAYFVKSAKRLRAVFVQHIGTKLEALKLFLSSARNNHDVYQNKETMANSKLTELWRDARTKLDQSQTTNVDWIGRIESSIALTPTLLAATELKPLVDDINAYVDEYGAREAATIGRRLRKALEAKYEEHISEFRRDLVHSDDVSALRLNPIEIDTQAFTDSSIGDPDIPYRLEQAIKQLPHDASEFIRSTTLGLDSVAKRLKDRITDGKFVSASRLVVETSITEIGAMLDGFVESVRLYRSAILAMDTRQLAGEAGITGTIDELEKIEIPSDRRDAWLEEIVSSVFPTWKEHVDEQEAKIADQLDELNAIRKSISNFRTTQLWPQTLSSVSSLPNMHWILTDLSVAGAIENAASQFCATTTAYFSSINDKCDQLMEAENAKYIEDKRAIRDLRKARFKKFVYLPMAIIFVGSVIYFGTQASVANNWGALLVVNLLSYGLIYILSKAWDRSKTQLEKREKRHVKKQRDVMERLVEEKSSKLSWQFLDPTQTEIAEKISEKIGSSSNDYIKTRVTDVLTDSYKEATAIATRLRAVCSSYIEAVSGISDGLTEYYTNTELNLEVLAKISAEIRQEAIEPSFIALNERNSAFGATKNRLSEIEIGLGSSQ